MAVSSRAFMAIARTVLAIPRFMLSPETVAEYRRMTPGQRLEIAFAMTRENTPYLLRGREDVVARRFELLQRENDLRNEGILRGMARLASRVGTALR